MNILLKRIPSFKNLSNIKNDVPNMPDKVDMRIQKMGSSYAISSRRQLENHYVKAKTKFRVFEAIVLSNALYGSAT